MPFMFNATIVNGMGLTGWLESPPVWKPSGSDTSASNGDVAASGGDLGAHVDVRFEFSDVLWPYSGYLAFYARVKPSAKKSEGIASGTITFTVLSPPGPGETELRRSTVNVPVKFQVIPTPPRVKRVLWSQYHSVRYPPGYIPRDNLEAKNDILVSVQSPLRTQTPNYKYPITTLLPFTDRRSRTSRRTGTGTTRTPTTTACTTR